MVRWTLRPPSGAEGPRRSGVAAWELLAAATAVALYLRTVGFGWVYDDQMEVVLNTFVRSFSNLPRWFGDTVWAGSGNETYLYRPLALASYAANYAVSGYAPWSYHLVNVALHGVASVLVVRVGLLWGLPAAAAGLGGVMFALHPVHVEVVAAVFGRKDLLATVFTLAALLTHRKALHRGGVHAALPVLSYLLAMLSKEIGVVALPLILIQDLRLEEDRRAFFDRRRVMAAYFAYLSALVAYLIARTAATGGLGIPDTSVFDNLLVALPAHLRTLTALVVVAKGLGLLLAPLSLSPDYSFAAIPAVASLADPRLVGPAALGLGLGYLVLRRPTRGAAWPVAAYAVALFPVSNVLLQTGTIFAERLLYLPSVAFCLSVGWLLARALSRVRSARWAVAGALVLLAAQTVRYAGAWTDDITLFSWATEHEPTSTKAHHKLGEELLRAGRLSEGLRALDEAVVLAPGNLYAWETLQDGVRLVAARYYPPPVGAGEALPGDPDLLRALGRMALALDDSARARRYLTDALRQDPMHAPSLEDLGRTSLAEADTAGALEHFARAVEVDPRRAVSWLEIARISLQRGDGAAAVTALRSFLRQAGPGLEAQSEWARNVLERLAGTSSR